MGVVDVPEGILLESLPSQGGFHDGLAGVAIEEDQLLGHNLGDQSHDL